MIRRLAGGWTAFAAAAIAAAIVQASVLSAARPLAPDLAIVLLAHVGLTGSRRVVLLASVLVALVFAPWSVADPAVRLLACVATGGFLLGVRGLLFRDHAGTRLAVVFLTTGVARGLEILLEAPALRLDLLLSAAPGMLAACTSTALVAGVSHPVLQRLGIARRLREVRRR